MNDQKAIKKYEEKIWGWDTGAIFFVPEGKDQEKTLQKYPELMEKIVQLCEEYFKEKGK